MREREIVLRYYTGFLLSIVKIKREIEREIEREREREREWEREREERERREREKVWQKSLTKKFDKKVWPNLNCLIANLKTITLLVTLLIHQNYIFFKLK